MGLNQVNSYHPHMVPLNYHWKKEKPLFSFSFDYTRSKPLHFLLACSILCMTMKMIIKKAWKEKFMCL